MRITVESRIEETPRVAQIRGLFDLAEEKTSRVEWTVSLPVSERDWNIGLIVGPSGSGKSTVAKHLFPREECLWSDALSEWPGDRSILDGFPEEMPIKDVAALLSSVGFSSPPAWLRPYHVLSTGQQFRCDLARLLATSSACGSQLRVFDEFTSTVDRTVAQIGSAAVARAIRQRNLKFVAVTCHHDVEEWLQPDWTYSPAENHFSWRLLRQRPRLNLTVFRCASQAWDLFAPHHYLSHSIVRSAWCWLASLNDRPVAFTSWIPFMGVGPKARREHRTVTLPDFQGIGIGNRLSNLIASMWTGLGYRATSTTTHPAMIQARLRSGVWQMTRAPGLQSGKPDLIKHAATRPTAGFRYIGPPMQREVAELLFGSHAQR